MGEIRLVSGKLRGRKLLAPEGDNTRPLLTRLRKSLVDILRPRLQGAKVLDLFGGSGAITFELLSGGAKKAVVVELDADAADLIKINADKLGVSIRVIPGDALKVAPRLDKASERFDVIIVAPPYNMELQEAAMDILSGTELLADGGIIVVQRDKRERFWEPRGNFDLYETRSYGRTVFDFYEWSEGS